MGLICRHGISPACPYFQQAMIFWNKIAGLKEPFALVGGIPKKIMAGMVSNEPPPATVLMNPAARPVMLKSAKIVGVTTENGSSMDGGQILIYAG